LGSGLDGWVDDIAINGSDIYAGGDFITAGGVSASMIAKWNGTNWSPLGLGLNGPVDDIAINGSDIIAGGNFISAVGVSANNIAKWNGSNWSPLGLGLNSGVYAIAVKGSDIYAGGNFTTAGGGGANSIALWNGTSWSPLGTGLNNAVLAIASNGSDIYAGGLFNTAGGGGANYIAKWNGTSWSPLGTGLNSYVRAIAIDPKQSLSYTPAAGFNGVDTFSYTITDGTTPATNTVKVLVNNSPVLDNSGTPTLTAQNQNDSNSSGTLVSTLISNMGSNKITDPNTGAKQGIAITGLDTTNGTWQYTTNGTTWNNAPTVSPTNALYQFPKVLLQI
jgi:Bacterial Ig domain